MKVSRLGVCLLVVVTAACRRESSNQTEQSAGTPSAAAPRQVWSSGQRASYELGFVTLSRAGASPVPLFLGLHARLDIAFHAAGSRLLATVALSDVRFVDQTGKPLSGTEQLVRELSQPFGLEFENEVLSAYFDPAGPHLATTGYRQSLAAVLQLPLGGAPARLGSTEWDASGLARVEYQRRPDGAWDWKKLDYERVALHRQSGNAAVSTKELKPEIVRSAGRVQLGPSGLEELKRQEEVSLRLDANQSLVADSELTLKRLEAPAVESSAAGLFDVARRRAVGVALASDQPAKWDEVMIAGRSYGDVVAELSGDARPSGQARANLFQALVALLRSEPKNVREAERSIRAASPVAETLLDALAMASTSESLRTLSALVAEPSWTAVRRKRAASSLIRAARPDAAALAAVSGLSEVPELREHALLGVGTFVRLFREQGEPGLAAQGTTFLHRAFAAARTPHDRKTVLLAIANSGEAGFYTEALSAQDDPDGDVRQAAIQAMRLMDGPEVEVRMVTLLTRPDANDVAATLHALGRRSVAQATVTTVEGLAKGHATPEVRRQAVLALVGWSERWPEVARTVTAVRESDPDERVRDVAVLPARG